MSNKGNEHKKITRIDKFARDFYCKHARLNRLRSDKRLSKRQYRHSVSKTIRNELNSGDDI